MGSKERVALRINQNEEENERKFVRIGLGEEESRKRAELA